MELKKCHIILQNYFYQVEYLTAKNLKRTQFFKGKKQISQVGIKSFSCLKLKPSTMNLNAGCK